MDIHRSLLGPTIVSVLGSCGFCMVFPSAVFAANTDLALEQAAFLEMTPVSSGELTSEQADFLAATTQSVDSPAQQIVTAPEPVQTVPNDSGISDVAPSLPESTASAYPLVVAASTTVFPQQQPPNPTPSAPLAETRPNPTPSAPLAETRPNPGLLQQTPQQSVSQNPEVSHLEISKPQTPLRFRAFRLSKGMTLVPFPLERIQYPLPFLVKITSVFGWRLHPISGTKRFHAGVDLAAPMGTPVLAAYPGQVVSAEWLGGYGLSVLIEHPREPQATRYAHLSKILVRPGQQVKRGTVIGLVGSSGNSTGPHLHFETLRRTPDGLVTTDAGPYLALAARQLPPISTYPTVDHRYQ